MRTGKREQNEAAVGRSVLRSSWGSASTSLTDCARVKNANHSHSMAFGTESFPRRPILLPPYKEIRRQRKKDLGLMLMVWAALVVDTGHARQGPRLPGNVSD